MITETCTQLHESALLLFCFGNPVGDIWDPFSGKTDTSALLRPQQREMPNENLLIISLLFMLVPTQVSYYMALKLGKMILEYPQVLSQLGRQQVTFFVCFIFAEFILPQMLKA